MYIQLLLRPLKFIKVINLIKMSNTSLFIPHVFANYTAADVAAVFEKLLIGRVSRVNLVPKTGKDRKIYNAAYIHFEFWFNNAAAHNFRERVLNPAKEARLVYDEPWYWVVLPYSKKNVAAYNNITRELPKALPVERDDFEIQAATIEDDHLLDEIEALMQEEDKFLVTFDSRYVQTLERELQEAREYMERLYRAYLNQSALLLAQQQPEEAIVAVVSP